jgi:hypothetical protein
MRCVICGQRFHTRNRRQETCGHRACQMARKRTLMRERYARLERTPRRKRGPRKPSSPAATGYGLDFCPIDSGQFVFYAAFGMPWSHGPDLYPLEFEPGWPADERMPPPAPETPLPVFPEAAPEREAA